LDPITKKRLRLRFCRRLSGHDRNRNARTLKTAAAATNTAAVAAAVAANTVVIIIDTNWTWAVGRMCIVISRC